MKSSNPVPTAVYYRSTQTSSSSGDSLWRNQPQTNAMASGTILFIAGGMELALGLGWNIKTGIKTTQQFQYSWFIGFIVGAILATPLISYLQKRFYLIISALLVLASGIIYVSVPFEPQPILAARYISGVGIGFLIVAFIVHGSEVAASSYRGAVLSLEQYGFTFGMAIQVIYASQWSAADNFSANRVHGIFLICFAVIALALIYLVVESPIFHICKSDHEAALECLRLLQRPQRVTSETKTTLEILRNYVVQEKNQSFSENMRKAIYPFVKTLLYRCMVAFTFSIFLSYSILFAGYYSLNDSDTWIPIVYVVLRVFGAFISLWLVDGLGRKFVSILSLLCIGGLTIGVGILYSNSFSIDSHNMSIVCTLMMIAQFFAGLFVPSTSVYLGEAFPLVLKPYFLALCVCVEQVIQIVSIVTFQATIYNTYVYFITVGVIICVLSIYFFLAIPETRNTSLTEAQKRFRNLLHLKMY